MSIKGPVTRADYQFSGLNRVQVVDPRDAIVMVRSPLFRIEAIVEVDVNDGAFVKHERSSDA